MKSKSSNISARQSRLVVQHLDGETLIYDLDANRAYCLNETAALVFNLCDGTRDVAAVSRTLSEQLGQTISEDFVWLAIEELKRNGLLANADQIETKFAGVSRREAIRKVGLASLAALPVVASLIAPTATSAASGVVCNSCTISLPLGQITQFPIPVDPTIGGFTTTGCVAGCTNCRCTIPGGGSSCSSTCTVN